MGAPSVAYSLRFCIVGVAVGVLCFTASPSTRAKNTSGADVLFEAARAAMTEGNYDIACQKFEESDRLERAPGTLLNLGNCEEKRGRVASSWARYTEAMDMLAPNDPRYAFAKKKAEALENRVPRLTVSLSKAAPGGTTLTRNGEGWTEPLGVPLRLDPLSYVIVVSAPDHESATYELVLLEGDMKTLTVAPGKALPNEVPPAPPRAPVVADETASRRQLGLIIGGVGAAAAVAGITFGALAYNDYKTVEEHCDVDALVCYDQKGDDAASRGATFELVAYGLGALGAGGLAVGGYLLLSEEDERTTVLEVGQAGGTSTVRVRGTF